jgi:hypothetical protein
MRDLMKNSFLDIFNNDEFAARAESGEFVRECF